MRADCPFHRAHIAPSTSGMLAVLIFLSRIVSAGAAGTPVQTSESNARLKQALARFPEANPDQDGILTMTEAIAWRARRQRNKATLQVPLPTRADVACGPYGRNMLDLWLPTVDNDTPLLVYFHGGGFTKGDKEAVRKGSRLNVRNFVQRMLDQGVAVASVQYGNRHLSRRDPAQTERSANTDIDRDGARAIQFLRYCARPYQLDANRFACFGGSAGPGTSVWIACA